LKVFSALPTRRLEFDATQDNKKFKVIKQALFERIPQVFFGVSVKGETSAFILKKKTVDCSLLQWKTLKKLSSRH
jgi:hypothetical protein